MTYLIVKLRMADIMKRLSKTAKLMRSLWKVSPNSFLVNTMMIVVLPTYAYAYEYCIAIKFLSFFRFGRRLTQNANYSNYERKNAFNPEGEVLKEKVSEVAEKFPFQNLFYFFT